MPLWLADQPLVLASKSEVRRARAGRRRHSARDRAGRYRRTRGRSARRHGDPGEIAALLAREKARAVAARLPGRLVLGADQTLALGRARVQQARRSRGGARAARGAARAHARAAFRDRAGARRRDRVRASRGRAADHARISRTTFSMPIWQRPASALTASVGGYQVEERRHPAVRAHRRRLISPSSGCRCCRCWISCGGTAGWRHDDREMTAACSCSA